MMTAISGLPAGVSLSPTGVLSAAASPGAGNYTIQAGISPAPAAASTGVIAIALTVVAPGSSVANMVRGTVTASVSPSLLTPLTSPVLGGRIACSGYTGCNTSTSQWKGDSLGHPMTQWQETSQNWNSNCDYGGFPVEIVNTNQSNQFMGVYIDNEVDSTGIYREREALITCAYNDGAQVILVGMYPAETNEVLDEPNGEQAGQMLEWYPFCNQQPTSGDGGMPGLSSMSELGYVTQQYYIPQGCTSGATAQEHNNEWNPAWTALNGTYDYVVNNLGHRIWSPWGDLLADY